MKTPLLGIVLAFAATSSALAAPQYSRPNATNDAGIYTAVGAPTLHEAVDEVTLDTGDYLEFQGGSNPAARTSTAELGLSDTLLGPNTSASHFIRGHFTCAACNSPVTLDIVLLDGGVEITRTGVQSTTTSLSVEYELSAGEADSIANYSGLTFEVFRVDLRGHRNGGRV